MTDRSRYRAYDKEYEKTRPSRVGTRSDDQRLWRHGVTGEAYADMLAAQDGVCLTCGKTPETEGQRLAVDHDHATGEIRGILCRYCNTADTLA